MMSGCFSNRSGPGCRPWISRPPSSTAVEFEPGMPKLSVGTSAVQATVLLAASGAATASGEPLPNSSGCFDQRRSEEHTSELQSLMRNSYAVFCLQKKKNHTHI